MAALPEDDAPTMTGTPGDRHVVAPTEEGDTTALAEAPATRSAPSKPEEEPSENDAEDRTVQQKVEGSGAERSLIDPQPVSQPTAAAAQPVAPPPPTMLSPAPPKPAAPPAPVAASARVGSTTSESQIIEFDDEEGEDSITATAPRINANNVPIAHLGDVQIRTLDEDDDPAEQTEVRTRPGSFAFEIPETLRATTPLHSPSQPPPPPRPAAGMPPPSEVPSTEPEPTDDDGVTTQAVAPRIASSPELIASLGAPLTSVSSVSAPSSPKPSTSVEPSSSEVVTSKHPRLVVPVVAETEELSTSSGVVEPATHPGLGEPETSPGVAEPATSPRVIPNLASAAPIEGYPNDDDDESVTKVGAPPAEPYAEDSVTTQAPALSGEIVAAAIATLSSDDLDDGTETSTQKRRPPTNSPADGEPGSITSQAPAPLTNMLRVIASDSKPELGPIDDDDDPPENRTAVMANAPLKRLIDAIDSSPALPAIRPTGPGLTVPHAGARASAAAPQLEPTSESGLRVARSGAGSDERASLGMLAANGEGRVSGVGRAAAPISEGSMDVRAHAATEAAFPAQPSVHDVDLGTGPRYGLLVGVVAALSILIPVTLFFALRHGGDEVAAGVPSEPVSEFVKHDGPRGKFNKSGKNPPPQPSASPSTSDSAHKPPPKGFPFKR